MSKKCFNADEKVLKHFLYCEKECNFVESNLTNSLIDYLITL